MAKINESSGNIFLDLGFPSHEAAVLLLRAELAEALRQWMESEGITQTQAGKRLGITQPRVSEIMRGKIELMSLDYMVGLCAKAGVSVEVRLVA
jgi:predicted XRE-type DNA-binding protein